MITFQETYEIITNSLVFKKFIQENPDAELVAGFFIIDFFSNDNKNSLDYKLDSKIFTFEIRKENEVIMREDRLIDDSKIPLLKISPEISFDLERISEIAQEKALENKITTKFNKIIAVLQNHENKQVWNLTCMLDQLIILHILIDSNSGEILKFERKSMMDFIKKK